MDKVCVCFCRVSTQQQDLVQQTNAIINEAEKMGYDKKHRIVIQYKESGITLAENERAGIDKLKESINKNSNIECVICWELSRIARRADVIYSMRDFFLSHKIQWVVLNPYMRLLENDGKMSQTSSIMLALFTSLAESEMEIKRERFKRGKARARELGKYTGGAAPFGYALTKDCYLIVEEKSASVVRLMFTMYATGKYSILSLSRELKELGYFDSFTTLPAIRTFVYKILKQKNYYGDRFHPPVISESLYNEVQIRLKENIRFPKGKGDNMLCKRLIYDDEGYCMSGRRKEKTGVDNIYCSQLVTNYKCSIAQKAVDPYVWILAKDLYHKHIMNATKLKRQQAEREDVLKKKMLVAKEKIEKIQTMIDRAEERYIHGNISLEKVNNITDSLRDEKKDWVKKKMLYSEQIRLLSQQGSNDAISETLDLDRLSFEDKCDLVRSVIERIVIRRPKPRCFIAEADVYLRVSDNVYQYVIKTPCGASRKKTTWQKIGTRKRKEGDIKDLSRRWNHIPINLTPETESKE